MRGLDKLRERAVERAIGALGGRPDREPGAIADLLDDTTLPGFLALLGWGGGDAGGGVRVGRDFLRAV
ncbi:MAG: hypothetical protein AB1689_12165, partial [Thermodesulfobacteriota bacterium]